jgi:redox-sensing transcriptional repressor
MMKTPPDIVIHRLALYLRFLEDCIRENTSATINSQYLSRKLHIPAHQIRKDLSFFGKFGAAGIGYGSQDLLKKIRDILGVDKPWDLCICGVGNLGTALLMYKGFRENNLNIVAAFDSDIRKIGRRKQGVTVYDIGKMPGILKRLRVDIAIIATPAAVAQEIADALVECRVRAILNFAPAKLTVPAHVKLRSVDLSTELINLTYFLCAAR